MSAQLRYAGCTSPIETKLLELLGRAKEPLHPKQCASRLGYTVEMVRTALGGLCASGKLKRRKSWEAMRPYEYTLASQPWPEDRTSKGELRAVNHG